jgi:hypothetical protein
MRQRRACRRCGVCCRDGDMTVSRVDAVNTFRVSAGRFTLFSVVSRNQFRCLRRSQNSCQRVRFPAAPQRWAAEMRPFFLFAICWLHIGGDQSAWRCVLDAGPAGIGVDAKVSRCRYRFRCQSPRLCGRLPLWIHCVVCGEDVAVSQGRSVSLRGFRRPVLPPAISPQRPVFPHDAPRHRPVGM